MSRNGQTKRPANYRRLAELEHQLDALRRNPLVRLGFLFDWSHVRWGLVRLWKGMLTLIMVAAAVTEILRWVHGH